MDNNIKIKIQEINQIMTEFISFDELLFSIYTEGKILSNKRDGTKCQAEVLQIFTCRN